MEKDAKKIKTRKKALIIIAILASGATLTVITKKIISNNYLFQSYPLHLKQHTGPNSDNYYLSQTDKKDQIKIKTDKENIEELINLSSNKDNKIKLKYINGKIQEEKKNIIKNRLKTEEPKIKEEANNNQTLQKGLVKHSILSYQILSNATQLTPDEIKGYSLIEIKDGYYGIEINLSDEGANKLKDFTQKNLHKPCQFLINRYIVSLATLQSPIGETFIIPVKGKEKAEEIIHEISK